MDVSVIIVNYNTSALIADSVKSILEKTKDIEYEVIIVDNNSEADFCEKICKEAGISKEENFHFIGLKENIGFGRANNEGLKIAQGRNIFFLNPDTVLINNAIKILSDFLDKNQEAGGCGGNLYGEDMSPAYSYRRFLPGIMWELNELLNNKIQKFRYGINSNFNHGDLPIEVGYISGADLMLKKEVLDKTGGFRKDYFLYYEETDLCYRVWKAGWKLYNVPAAKIQHLESKSMGEGEYQSDFKTRHIEESRSIYYRLNHNYLNRKISDGIYGLFLRSRVILLKNSAKKEYYRKRLEYLKGI